MKLKSIIGTCIFLIFTLSSMTFGMQQKDAECAGVSGGYCKNRPDKNTGLCVEDSYKICCKFTSQSCTDCYGIGQ